MDQLCKIEELNNGWASCQKCELGQRRALLQQPAVLGEGVVGGIMIIGEGPGRNEEECGRPFIGKSGELLRDLLTAYGLDSFCYLTNIVTCRSCELMMDENNQPRIRKFRGQPDEFMYKDISPTPLQMAACSDRIHEEIYLVDPVVILAVGAVAASFLMGRPVSITKERGRTRYCEVPGRAWLPQLTEKRKVWARKIKGEEALPVVRNQVKYLTIPTLHPAFVLRKEGDQGTDSPWNQLALDVKLTGEIFEAYMARARGIELRAGGPQENEHGETH